MRLTLRAACVVLISLGMIAVGLSTAAGILGVANTSAGQAFTVARAWQPLGGPAWIPAARKTLSTLVLPENRDRLLRELLIRHPLEADVWLHRARAAHSLGHDSRHVLELVTLAVSLHPNHAGLHWQAAMVALQIGDTVAAEEALRRYVELDPAQVERAFAIARRWHSEPHDLLQAVLGVDTPIDESLLQTIVRWRDWPLADAVWERLPAADRKESGVAGVYVNGLLGDGEIEQAIRIWQSVEPGFSPGNVFNGDFSRPLQQRTGFDWRISAPDGVEAGLDDRQHVSAPASLRLSFDGKHNPNLTGPSQIIPVLAGGRYRLTGYWRGENLTTRSLPGWQVIDTQQNRTLASIAAPAGGSWDWQPFALDFTAPQAHRLIRIELRRQPSRDLDRLLGGRLYLDDLALQEVGTASVPDNSGETL